MSAFDGGREDWEAPPRRDRSLRLIIAASIGLGISLLGIFATVGP